MATNVTIPPSGVVTIAPTPGTDLAKPRNKYKNILYKLGITEIVLGITAVLLCVASIIFASNVSGKRWYYYYIGLTYISPGIWCGVVPIISGCFGLRAMKNPSVYIYNANMATSITSSFFMLILFIMSIMSAAACEYYAALVALHALLIIISFSICVVNIVHSAYCCAGVCCRRKSQTAVVYNTNQPASNAQYVQLANGQYMLVQNPIIVGQPYATVPPMQVPGQPVVFQQPPTTSPFVPQGQVPPYPINNPVKGQSVPQMPPEVMNATPPPYNVQNYTPQL